MEGTPMKRLFHVVSLFLVFAAIGTPASGEDTWKTLPDPAPLPKPDQVGLAPVNDIKMHYEIYNPSGGNPIILLHGGLGSTLDWGNQVPALVKHHEVIALDSRGQGRSTR